MVESATRACQPMIALPPEPANSNWDAIAVALTSQGNAITFASAVIAFIAAVAGIGWGKIVIRDARETTEREAYIEKWLAETAPGIVQKHVNLLLDAMIGPGDDSTAADDLGENAG